MKSGLNGPARVSIDVTVRFGVRPVSVGAMNAAELVGTAPLEGRFQGIGVEPIAS
jgi:hypothetical protein